ncbi:MAG: proline--tRNA ligase [Actinobacteria bacterium]|nr:proline--tRNA ligase [Actinomycetota bacterium]
MKFSQFFIPTLKEIPSEAEIPSHSLALRAGLIRKVASGIYSFLPLGFRVLKKIEEIIRQEMNNSGAIELFLPIMQPSVLWEKSGRWKEYGPEMFRLKDRNKRDFCLGPTHEELITYLAYLDLKSYKNLPVNLYQIQVKFRDEMRPRYGLLRAREFIMKDAYSFCRNDDDLVVIYKNMYDAYCRILERIGLQYKVVEAETGLIGGSYSHEFIVLAENGEEKLVFCPACGYSANYEMSKSISKTGKENKDNKINKCGDFTYTEQGDRCINCGKELKIEKGIEVGHIFKLGDKYSEKMDARFIDVDGKLKPLVMGCYGIGVTRILAAAIEQLHDDKGIIWPASIAPFTVNIIVTTEKNSELSKAGDMIYKTLKKLNVEVLYDDRDVSAGIKFKDSDLIGIPVRFILGRKFLGSRLIDVEYRKDCKKVELPVDTIPKFIKEFEAANSLKLPQNEQSKK